MSYILILFFWRLFNRFIQSVDTLRFVNHHGQFRTSVSLNLFLLYNLTSCDHKTFSMPLRSRKIFFSQVQM